MASVILGNDVEIGQPLHIGDIERRSGLYILGKPGMGKSALLVNIMNQDIEHGHGLFCLDPHTDAITDLLNRGDYEALSSFAKVLDPEDEKYSFGINLLSCRDITSLRERTATYTKAYNVFYKLWEDEWGPWLQLILQNTLWAFIENPEYTLAEVPIFLNPRNSTFRNHIIGNIKYSPAVVDFWKYEFFERRERDQQERVDAALTRVTTLLTHPYIRHIIGQRKTTIDFAAIMKPPIPTILLVKLSANLAADIKKFIGTILISELLHAVRNRPENQREQFCIFVDEFQNFTNSDDFTTLITEGRKFGVATTICHVERYGQFAENQKLLGATSAAVNKVFFQLTVKDAQELSQEIADKPDDTKTRLGGELILSARPVKDIWEKGHPHDAVMDLSQRYFWLVNLLHSKPQEKYFQFDPNITLAHSVNKGKLSQQYFNDWEMYRSSPDMIREGISLLNQYYYDWMKHKYDSNLVSEEEIEIMMKVIECFGGVLGWRPTMTPYIPDDMRDLFRQRIKDYREKRYEEFANRERAKNRDKDVHWQRWLRDHPTGSGFKTEDLPIDPDALEVIMLQSTRENRIILEIPSNISLHEIDILRGEALRVGMTSLEVEKIVQWKVRELHEMERGPLEALVRLQANMNIDEAAYKASVRDISKEYTTIMSRVTIESGIGSEAYHALPEQERLAQLQIMVERIVWLNTEMLIFITKCFDYCGPILEREPIQIQSARYDETPLREKTQGEMVDEAVQELANLPRFTAFAKVIEEKEDEQFVLKQKIKTLPLPPLQKPQKGKPDIESRVIANGHRLCKERVQIEDEIGERQKRWRRNTASRRPPPSEEQPAHS